VILQNPIDEQGAGADWECYRPSVRKCNGPLSRSLQLNAGVKRNFWSLQNFWPIVVCQLFCFSEQRNKVWRLCFWCVLCRLNFFVRCQISIIHDKLQYRNNYNHWKILDLLLDVNYFSFSNSNSNLTRHTYLNTNPKALIISFLSVFDM